MWKYTFKIKKESKIPIFSILEFSYSINAVENKIKIYVFPAVLNLFCL